METKLQQQTTTTTSKNTSNKGRKNSSIKNNKESSNKKRIAAATRTEVTRSAVTTRIFICSSARRLHSKYKYRQRQECLWSLCFETGSHCKDSKRGEAWSDLEDRKTTQCRFTVFWTTVTPFSPDCQRIYFEFFGAFR